LSSGGSPLGRLANKPSSLGFSARLMRSQLRNSSSRLPTLRSSNTWGWRRIILAAAVSRASARVKAPRRADRVDTNSSRNHDVAQFLGRAGGVVRADAVHQFEGFLDDVVAQGLRGLRLVPGTAFGREQGVEDFLEMVQGGGVGSGVIHVFFSESAAGWGAVFSGRGGPWRRRFWRRRTSGPGRLFFASGLDGSVCLALGTALADAPVGLAVS